VHWLAAPLLFQNSLVYPGIGTLRVTPLSLHRFTLGPGEGLSADQVEGIELLAVSPDGFEGTIPELVGLMTSAAWPATGREPFGGAETGSSSRHRPRHQRGTRDHSC
jgi:hypothetical protein